MYLDDDSFYLPRFVEAIGWRLYRRNILPKIIKDVWNKDTEVMFFIQQVISLIFCSNMDQWSFRCMLRQYHSTANVKSAKFQTLCRKFETLQMKDSDCMHDYLCNMLKIVN